MPVVSQLHLLPFPELDEDERPHGHEASKEHRRLVVEHAREPGNVAALSQAPVAANAAASRTHRQAAGAFLVAYLGKLRKSSSSS